MLKIHLNTTKKIHISMNSVVGDFVSLITPELIQFRSHYS